MSNNADKKTQTTDKNVEKVTVKVTDHVRIVDKNTGKEVLNRRG